MAEDRFNCRRLHGHDGSIEGLCREWSEQAQKFEGDPGATYAKPFLEHARQIACETPAPRKYGIYALCDGDHRHHMLFHANVAALPGTKGDTLRVLWVQLAPIYDYEDRPQNEIVDITTSLFNHMVGLCNFGVLQANHMKLHLQNVGDRRYAIALANAWGNQQSAATVVVRGNWLHFENVR